MGIVTSTVLEVGISECLISFILSGSFNLY